MDKKIQILGMSQYLVSVIFDILNDNGQANFLDIFLNLKMKAIPQMPNFEFPYALHELGNGPDKKNPVIFGASGPKNKFPIFNYFKDTYKLSIKQFINVVHQTSYISKSVTLDAGCFVEQNVTISSQTKLGFGITIKRGALIGHHCIIGDFVDINPGAIIAGKVILGKGSVIGAGATILDGINIGKNSVIGAGSLVTKDIPSGVIAYGNPCKIIRNNSKWNIE
ncbi:sugar O-acyltransferase (sialic acid O-acetyltransferase NeuD family) [Gillisia sp. Hel_I_86]|uniref:acetyltransferase n=1 Tax=Gillisia sp. Hel_I_86 TaxID=1249981 RepID=UPI001199E1F7|nr:acetyltransferase [Gillisia sp. Hel_I_86]TVZ28202.1 sugar O-acyltransferase (sialic acid O-acetyltransferase NeuD family) [Gillisia sp. Hel_I_86]